MRNLMLPLSPMPNDGSMQHKPTLEPAGLDRCSRPIADLVRLALRLSMPEPLRIYVFRDPHFAPDGDTLVCIAERTRTEKFIQKKEIDWAFSGHVAYRCWCPWKTYVGVYGRKNTSRFRRFLRERGANLDICREAPPKARLLYWVTQDQRRKVGALPPRVT